MPTVIHLDGEFLEDADINLARFAFSRLQSCLWARREMWLRTKGRIYQALVHSSKAMGRGHVQGRQRIFGYAQWRLVWVQISSELAQVRRGIWAASIRQMTSQVQVRTSWL